MTKIMEFQSHTTKIDAHKEFNVFSLEEVKNLIKRTNGNQFEVQLNFETKTSFFMK